MKKPQFASLIFMVTSMFIISCSKDDDKKPPLTPDPGNLTITLSNPTESLSFDAGKNIVFNATFEDKVALGDKYKIKINFVSATKTPVADDNSKEWVYDKKFNMEDKTDPKKSVEKQTIKIENQDGSPVK